MKIEINCDVSGTTWFLKDFALPALALVAHAQGHTALPLHHQPIDTNDVPHSHASTALAASTIAMGKHGNFEAIYPASEALPLLYGLCFIAHSNGVNGTLALYKVIQALVHTGTDDSSTGTPVQIAYQYLTQVQGIGTDNLDTCDQVRHALCIAALCKGISTYAYMQHTG